MSRERQDAVRHAVVAGDEGEHLRGHLERVEVVDRGQAVLPRHEVGDLLLGHVPERHEHGAEAPPALLLLHARRLELPRG